MKQSPVLLLLIVLAACSGDRDVETSVDERPNILLIVVDDMGYSDIGSFGSEIETPNLDELALNGVRLTNFNVAATCSPTRSMLLTGVDSHKAGLGNMLEELSPNQQGQPGYEGYLNDRVVTVATLLRDGGYRTMMTGKWHLGQTPETGPNARGFDRAFSLIPGGASHFADMRPAYAPSPDIKAKYSEDGKLLERLPDAFEYSSQFFVDRMIDYLNDTPDDKPFFAFLSFTAPHWPLQAPAEAIEKYKGRYDDGYEALLGDRLQRAQQLSVVPDSAVVGPPPPKFRPWGELTDEEKKVEARAMEIYAAMIDEVDRHTGRLLDHLRSTGKMDNTVIVFMSDNGAEGHDLDETWPADLFPDIRRTIDASHDFSYDAMGHSGSYVLYGPNWARAGSPAFSLYKAFPTEGGTRVAAFISYPGLQRPQTRNDLVSVLDMTPTFLELAGVDAPTGTYKGRAVETIEGHSIVPLLDGRLAAGEGIATDRVIASELFGKRFVQRGTWKLVHMPPPYGNGN